MQTDSVATTIRVYSRPGCHLCEELLDELQSMVRDQIAIEVVNIDDRAAWSETYGSRIPVVECDGKFVCQYTLDRNRIAAILDRSPRS